MAKNTKGLIPFKKGQSGNPQGGRIHNAEIKRIKNLSEAELVEVASFIINSRINDLKAKIKEPETTTLQGMVIGLALRTASRGDPSAFNALMDRLLGKVKEKVEITSNNTNVTAEVVTYDEDKLKAVLAKIRSDV